MIEDAHSRLDEYCHEVGFKGWDLFDGLNSRLFRNSPLYASPASRLAWIQFFKRSPVNLRRVALVPKEHNPKGLGLFASACLALGKTEEARVLLNRLKEMACSGNGTAWGYNFPWQARAFYVPVGTPNMVTTVFIANAFLDFHDRTGDKGALGIARSSCEFILDRLTLLEDEESLCFGYIPGEKAIVHNANMLGAALLGRLYFYDGDEKLFIKSRKAMAYSMEALTKECFWPYGELGHHQFIDNFHTGFNLVALKSWMDATGDTAWEEPLRRAYERFLDAFWLENGCPKYYHNLLYPIDIHCSAQGIVTCLKLAEYDRRSLFMARRIAEWAIENMQDEEGCFYYQRTRSYTNKIPYIRWGQAWMSYALAIFMANARAQGERL
jgi:hypothetical protein